MAKVPVTIYIDEDEEIEAIRLKPLGSELSTECDDHDKKTDKGTNKGTLKATFQKGEPDAEADVTWDF